MNFNKVEENVTAENEDTIHLTIFSATIDFSNESRHLPSLMENSFYWGDTAELKDIGHVLKVFPNGMGEDDIGYVSLMLCHHMNLNNFEGTCIISVIDASGDARFPQSFTFFDQQKDDSLSVQPAAIEKYISRKMLLSDPDDLLPQDILTLKIDIYVSTNYRSKSRLEISKWSPSTPMIYYVNYNRGKVVFNLNSPLGKKDRLEIDEWSSSRCLYPYNMVYRHNGNFILNLSTLGERLAEESSYFRNIIDSPMKEGSTKIMHIPKNEFKTFESLRMFLTDSKTFFNSAKEIFDMYIVADKYDIPFAVEFSKCFLKLCLFDHRVDELLEMTEELEDDNLKDLMKLQINLISKEYNAEDILTFRVSGVPFDVALLKEPVHGGFCVYQSMKFSSLFYFLQEKSIDNEVYIAQNREEVLLDFYK